MYSGPDVRVLRPVCRQGLIYSGLSGLNVLRSAYTLPGLNVGIQAWLYQGRLFYTQLSLNCCTETALYSGLVALWVDVLRPSSELMC